MNFSQWKAVTMQRLLELMAKYKDNNKILNDLSVLVRKLNYLKARDIASFLYYLHVIARDNNIKELYEIVPSDQEIKFFFFEE